MSAPPVDRLEIGPAPRPTRPALRRRLVRGVLAGVAASLVLLVATLTTARDWRPPPLLPPLDAAPLPAVAPWDRHLPYAYVDRLDMVTATGAPARVVRPRGAEGTIPGVVLVTGAGRTTRDDLSDEAEALARGGLAVITYDERTTGYSVLSRDDDRLADDALAALATVARQPGVDPDRVGMLGFGEGGWVVPLAAARPGSGVAFTVLVSAPVVSPLDQSAWVVDRTLRAAPVGVRAAAETGLATARPLLGHLGTDVTPAIARATQPSYAVWGAADRSVPVAEAVTRYRAATGQRGRVEVVGGAGHRVPVATGWAERVSDWVRRGYPSDDRVRGEEPTTSVGVPTLPGPSLPADPRLHLGLTAAAVLLAALWPARPRVRSARRG